MKKLLIFVFSLLMFSRVFSESYKIENVIFNIDGKTKENNILKNCPIETSTIFNDKEELISFIKNYEIELANLRIFEDIKIQYKESEQNNTEKTDKPLPIILTINLKESFSFLAVPYFKFDSNTGSTFKIKAKDTNFLGSLNTMDFDVNFQILTEDETDAAEYLLGANFKYDFPFHIGIVNTTLINDYTISYTFGNNLPEWDGRLGLNFSLPINNINLELELNQYAKRDTSFAIFGDDIYFTENIKFSVPILLFSYNNVGDIKYTPYTSFTFNWDKDGINIKNNDLSSPIGVIGHSLSFGRINWIQNMREGFNFAMTNSLSYNFQRNEFIPYINLEINSHWNFKDSSNWFLKRLGINTKLYSFVYIPLENNKFYYGEKYGNYLRGIRDEQFFNENTDLFASEKALSSFTAINLCFDFPISLFTTKFTKSFLRYFNFELQVSPFIDISLGYNRYTKRFFHPRDGFYTAGLELLVYPLKWSSFTVRGCLGVDMGRLLNIVDNSWRSDVSLYEFSFGIGLHY